MATARWRGDAVAIAQVDTITPGGTIGTETFTCTINGKDITYTAESGDTVALVVAGLVAVWNASTIPEFAEITATDSTTTMTLTHDTKGVPFTVTSSASGSATNVQATSTSATGPHHFNDADNWTNGSVPVDGDTIVYDSGNVDCLYGLSQGGVTPAALNITRAYTGKIGLPEINGANPAAPYREYRTDSLTLCDSGDATNTTITIGEGDGTGSSRIRLDTNTGQVTGTVLSTGQRELVGVPALLIKGTHASNEWNILKGDVGGAYYASETTNIATLRVGWVNNQLGDARVELGEDHGTITTLSQSGGVLIVDGAVTTHSMTDGECTYRSGNVTTLNMDGGTVYYKGTGTITTANLGSDASLDFRRDMRGRTVTNCNLYEGCALHDPFGTVTFSNGLDLIRTSPNDVEFDLPQNKTWTATAI